MAVARLEIGAVEYASGDTLGKVAMGLIPRVLWPDKPAVGGGGSVVHDFTGIEFAEGTSFGAGQVFEFYVNFGSLGVIGGFLLYGWLIGRMDLSVIKYLRQGDQRRFLLWFLTWSGFIERRWQSPRNRCGYGQRGHHRLQYRLSPASTLGRS